MPVEWLLIGVTPIIWGLYVYHSLPLPGAPGATGAHGPLGFYLKQIYASLYSLAFLYSSYAVLVFARVAYYRANKRQSEFTWKGGLLSLTERLEPYCVWIDFRVFHAVSVMFLQFQLLKHLIPMVNSALYDGVFWNLESRVCGGACAQILHGVLGERVRHTVSMHYEWYYPFMIGSIMVMTGIAPRRMLHEFTLAFVLLFLMGIGWVYVVPTWGPAFFRPDLFAFISDTGSGGMQHELWRWKSALEINRLAPGALFSISGFPSLHVAVVLLAAVYATKLHLVVGLLAWSFLILMAISTIYLGWHYVLDDIGSCILVFCCVNVAKRFPWGEGDLNRVSTSRTRG